MDANGRLAPDVVSILDEAAERAAGETRLSVTPRSLEAAFEAAEADGQVPVIAEVKPTSPTTDGRIDADPVALAKGMVEGGAAALSVLTEPAHFGGSPEMFRRVRSAVEVPVLRKDFLLAEGHLDVVEADVVLLIARFLDDVSAMLEAARDRGFRALIEVHDREEVAEAVAAGADLIGINNRDLARLTVDLGTFERVAPAVPNDVTLIAESGIETPEHVRRMRDAGADGILIGSAIMAGDVRETTARLVDA